MTTVVEFTMFSCLLGVGRRSGTVLCCWLWTLFRFYIGFWLTLFFCHLDKSWGDLGEGTQLRKCFHIDRRWQICRAFLKIND